MTSFFVSFVEQLALVVFSLNSKYFLTTKTLGRNYDGSYTENIFALTVTVTQRQRRRQGTRHCLLVATAAMQRQHHKET
jgi:hypothetical protein